MKLYLNVVEVAIEHDEKFLIIKRPEGKNAGGLLAFPGGKVEGIDEQNEWDILRLAGKREILEEVGLDLKDDLKYITNNHFVHDSGAHVIKTIFHCKIEKTNLTINASPLEVAEYYWLTDKQIHHAHNALYWLKKSVQYIRQGL
jgi:8-oxo-dGTP diphosphatase